MRHDAPSRKHDLEQTEGKLNPKGESKQKAKGKREKKGKGMDPRNLDLGGGQGGAGGVREGATHLISDIEMLV